VLLGVIRVKLFNYVEFIFSGSYLLRYVWGHPSSAYCSNLAERWIWKTIV